MAERDALQKRYAYQEMSNKVEQADRSLLRSLRSEPTGEVESLRGQKDVGRMGDRVIHYSGGTKAPRPAELEKKMDKARKRRRKEDEKKIQSGLVLDSTATSSRKKESVLAASGGQTVLDLDLTGYQPTNPSCRAAYESLLVGLFMY